MCDMGKLLDFFFVRLERSATQDGTLGMSCADKVMLSEISVCVGNVEMG